MRTSSPFYCLAAALHVVLLAASLLLSSVTADEYTYGRATFYDDNQQGSCQYFNNIPEWYGAWPDSMPGFPNCGSCWEVSCVDSDFSDGFGSTLQRSSACYDTSRSVVIQIVDSCPCVHQNFHSNQRWCCGDMNHLDLGRKAYQELADVKWGVIGLRWKPASCDQLGPRLSSTQPLPPPASLGSTGNSNGGLPIGVNSDGTNGGDSSGGSNDDSSSGNSGRQGWSGWSKSTQRSFGDLFAGGWMDQGM